MLSLKYSHNVIEHLGIKLYQNKPTNVLAELISNSWDAYAKNAYIDIYKDENYIAVFDDGYAMTYQEIIDNYLIIGKHKRTSKLDDSILNKKYSRIQNMNNRGPMGRKGIGKLAPFGISKLISLITVSLDDNNNHKVTWLELDLEKMIQDSNTTQHITDYKPNVILDNVNYSKELLTETAEKNTTAIKKFINKIEYSGTLILLNNLSLKKHLNADSIIKSIGRRFTVTLLRDDFNVFIDDQKVEEKDALPKFEYRIPQTGFSTESLQNGKEVKYWVGFVETADWSSDEAGVGVYAHGKIAQERPFTFKSKGREIYTRYMYAVVEADWLDELDEDVISTDRTNINWDAEELNELSKWGYDQVAKWVASFVQFKKEKTKKEIVKDIQDKIESKKVPKITHAEQAIMNDLLSELYVDLGKEEETKEKLLIATANAWTHKPMKEMVKKLWDRLKEKDLTGEQFYAVLDQLNDYAVPESLSLSVTFAQKAYALNLLYKLIHEGREVDLQKLIEYFPWILKPDMEKLTANQTLKTMVLKATSKGLAPGRYNHSIGDSLDVHDGKKPDFVFLSNGPETEFCIVEIKHPSEEITINNREQLQSYMTYLESKYPQQKRHGILIGNNTHNIENTNPNRIEFITWDEIFRQSRVLHIDYLSSMLKISASEISDDRMKDIKHFGGKETIELITKISENSIEMKDLIAELSQLNSKKS